MAKNKQKLEWVITDDFGGKDNVALMVALKGWDYTAYIKWDGCCEIKGNGKQIDMHICDVPQFIDVLQSLEDFRMSNIYCAE